MGYSISWAAVKNGTLEALCSVCDLQSAGKHEEVPESPIVAAELPAAWYLVLHKRAEIDDQVLATLSAETEVVSCFVEDHVMFSSASGWMRGKQIWSVFHDSERGRYHLEVTGKPPASLKAIRDRLTEEQNGAGGEKADVDYIYEIPAELAKALTGFRHDEDLSGGAGAPYLVLESAGATSLLTKLISTFKGSKKSSVVGLIFFAVLFSPVLLVAALISIPVILTLRLAQKLRVKRAHV